MPDKSLQDKTAQVLNAPHARPSPLNPKADESVSYPPLLSPLKPPVLPYLKPNEAAGLFAGSHAANFHPNGPVFAAPVQIQAVPAGPVTQSRSSLAEDVSRKRPASDHHPHKRQKFLAFDTDLGSPLYNDDLADFPIAFSQYPTFDSPSLSAAKYPLDFESVDFCSSDVVLGAIPTTPFQPGVKEDSLSSPFDLSALSFNVPHFGTDSADHSQLMQDSDDEDNTGFAVRDWTEVKSPHESPAALRLALSPPKTVISFSSSLSPKQPSNDVDQQRILRNGKSTTFVAPMAASSPHKPPVKVEAAAELNPDDNVVSIGEYTRAERKRKIARFKNKQKNRTFTKKIIYKCRQSFAQRRPRVGGRFVSLGAASA